MPAAASLSISPVLGQLRGLVGGRPSVSNPRHAGPTTQVRSEARAGRRNSPTVIGTCFRNRQDQQNSFLEIVDTRSQAAHRRNATALVREEQDPSTRAAAASPSSGV